MVRSRARLYPLSVRNSESRATANIYRGVSTRCRTSSPPIASWTSKGRITPRPVTDLPIPDYYAVLGVAAGAPADDIKRAFRREAKFWYPNPIHVRSQDDIERCTKSFLRIKEAWDILGHDDSRKKYDTILDELRSIDVQLAIVVSNQSKANYSSIKEAIENNPWNYPIIVMPGTYLLDPGG